MLPTIDALKAQWKGDRLMKKNSTVVKNGNKTFKQPALTIGLDLGDRLRRNFSVGPCRPDLEALRRERTHRSGGLRPPALQEDAHAEGPLHPLERGRLRRAFAA